MKFDQKTTRRVKYGAQTIVVFVGLLAPVVLGPCRASAQSEIDPDHFDSRNTEPIPLPRTGESKVTLTRTFSLPYSVLCNEKKLAPGKYSISLRSDGNVGQVTVKQKGRAIEIAGVVQTRALERRDEVVVVENNKNERTLSVVRVSGFDFVFAPTHAADLSPDTSPKRAEKLPLTVIALRGIANQVPDQAAPKP